MGKTGLFDLEKQFAFYGAYHTNPVNVLIHMLFVWPIFFTFIVLFYFLPPFFNLSHLGFLYTHGLVLNFGFFFALTYALFYVFLDKKAGSLAALLCLGCWVLGSSLANHLGFSLAWKVVLVAQIFCWTTQVIGHGIFEKRAPDVVDNFAQALLLVPFLVLLEVLQTFFGYEPYPGFNASVKAMKEAEIYEWQKKTQKKIT